LSFFAFCLGGCGAPLRDKGGAPIANLRKFSKENESSPRNNADLRRSGRHGSNQQIDNGNDSDGSNDGRYDSRRRSSAREFDGDHDNIRSIMIEAGGGSSQRSVARALAITALAGATVTAEQDHLQVHVHLPKNLWVLSSR
jgi:hypothetical protein